eukprot:CAMPEP_0177589858 /NCGR_PEP_ID=MMETSP0419_2-20121207/7058_1 /TAXON_ID=582737 /ORGANISM="Tetraselmis sp., Strain GSL018" /LENGTH=140 /DNA_ID=CAMNT_0019080301 /DNA_START=571 /DNA_END=989 /DNA_ORIENTATION=+
MLPHPPPSPRNPKPHNPAALSRVRSAPDSGPSPSPALALREGRHADRSLSGSEPSPASLSQAGNAEPPPSAAGPGGPAWSVCTHPRTAARVNGQRGDPDDALEPAAGLHQAARRRLQQVGTGRSLQDSPGARRLARRLKG